MEGTTAGQGEGTAVSEPTRGAHLPCGHVETDTSHLQHQELQELVFLPLLGPPEKGVISGVCGHKARSNLRCHHNLAAITGVGVQGCRALSLAGEEMLALATRTLHVAVWLKGGKPPWLAFGKECEMFPLLLAMSSSAQVHHYEHCYFLEPRKQRWMGAADSAA